MVIKAYTVTQLFLCQPSQTDCFFLKLKLIRAYFLVHETLISFPTKMYTEVSSQLWLNSGEYLPKGSRTGRALTWASKHERNLLAGLGAVSWLPDNVNHYLSGLSSSEWTGKRTFKRRTKGKGVAIRYLWGAMAPPYLLFIFSSLGESFPSTPLEVNSPPPQPSSCELFLSVPFAVLSLAAHLHSKYFYSVWWRKTQWLSKHLLYTSISKYYILQYVSFSSQSISSIRLYLNII